MRGATGGREGCRSALHISIHAPHARSDDRHANHDDDRQDISIHAPHARSDGIVAVKRSGRIEFQSTLLMRGATTTRLALLGIFTVFQSTLLMRGATEAAANDAKQHLISIHAPHARSDNMPRA